MLLSISF